MSASAVASLPNAVRRRSRARRVWLTFMKRTMAAAARRWTQRMSVGGSGARGRAIAPPKLDQRSFACPPPPPPGMLPATGMLPAEPVPPGVTVEPPSSPPHRASIVL